VDTSIRVENSLQTVKLHPTNQPVLNLLHKPQPSTEAEIVEKTNAFKRSSPQAPLSHQDPAVSAASVAVLVVGTPAVVSKKSSSNDDKGRRVGRRLPPSDETPRLWRCLIH